MERLTRSFSLKQYDVAVNTPYAGTITSLAYYRKDPRVISVMIEVNRSLYLDRDFRKNAAFSSVRRDIAASIDELKAWLGY